MMRLTVFRFLLQKLKSQEQCSQLVLELAKDMAFSLGYIEDVKQFARLGQLKLALKDVTPLIEDTTNFILQFISRGQGPSSLPCFSAISNPAIRIVIGSLLSHSDQENIDELTKRFNRFKQQFDRGVSVQAAGTLEMLLEEMGMFLRLLPKVNY